MNRANKKNQRLALTKHRWFLHLARNNPEKFR
nr:MAG TPA: hypothetical protein [Caudoviricetes sp.]